MAYWATKDEKESSKSYCYWLKFLQAFSPSPMCMYGILCRLCEGVGTLLTVPQSSICTSLIRPCKGESRLDLLGILPKGECHLVGPGFLLEQDLVSLALGLVPVWSGTLGEKQILDCVPTIASDRPFCNHYTHFCGCAPYSLLAPPVFIFVIPESPPRSSRFRHPSSSRSTPQALHPERLCSVIWALAL